MFSEIFGRFFRSWLLDQYKGVILKDCIRKKLIGYISGFEHMFNVNVKLKHIISLLLALCNIYDMDTSAFKIGKKIKFILAYRMC
jgi:hypothetical protein